MIVWLLIQIQIESLHFILIKKAFVIVVFSAVGWYLAVIVQFCCNTVTCITREQHSRIAS